MVKEISSAYGRANKQDINIMSRVLNAVRSALSSMQDEHAVDTVIEKVTST